MRELRDKRALVTGAASGIGKAIAQRLASCGTHLVLSDCNEVGLETVAREVRSAGVDVATFRYDASAPSDVVALAQFAREQADGIDLLVNNAGITYHGVTDRMNFDSWEQLLAVNLHAPIRLTHELLPYLLIRQEAHILNVCSVLGLVGLPKVCAYNTTKFGLVGYTESLRSEYSKQGIGVTALCPGLVKTNLFRDALENAEGLKKTPPDWVCTTPEKVAAAAEKAIRRNRATVVLEPVARGVFTAKRIFPWLLDWSMHLGRRRHTSKRLEKAEKRAKKLRESQVDTQQVRRVA